MASYTNEYSQLPNEILTLHNYKDVDDTVASYVNQIKILQAQGKYDKVNEIMKAHPELKPYIFGAEDAMALQEETRNLEILALWSLNVSPLFVYEIYSMNVSLFIVNFRNFNFSSRSPLRTCKCNLTGRKIYCDMVNLVICGICSIPRVIGSTTGCYAFFTLSYNKLLYASACHNLHCICNFGNGNATPGR